jgi:ATP phosphoribosyltransferase regulatory subunit
MGILASLIDEITDSQELKEKIISFLSMKNSHDLEKALEGKGGDKLLRLLSLPRDVNGALKDLKDILGENEALSELTEVLSVLSELGFSDNISIDFSIINDAQYYNGIVFRGYLLGAPRQVLSGGRYDGLADKFKRGQGALGFAVYLGELPASSEDEGFDCDTLIISSDAKKAVILAETLRNEGKSVRIERVVPRKIRAKEILEV